MSTTRLAVPDVSEVDLRHGIESTGLESTGVETCLACQHPRESHDATSSRFCAATTTLGATRRCVCRVETLDGAQRAASSHRFNHAMTVPRGV